MDETSMAFGMPHERASATSAGNLPDRISVRDYTRTVEIGAFTSERGVAQRIRFNIVLEVSHHTAAQDDDVDKVISYDTITEAVEAELAAERINLLETLAERVARRCLADPRALRVFVRIEKLDRIPGTLGVEIMRARVADAAPRLRPVTSADAEAERSMTRRPWVVYLPRTALAAPEWRDALARLDHPAIVCVEPSEVHPRASSVPRRRIGLLAIEQDAWRLADRDPSFEVVASRTEIDWALKHGRHPVWAPGKMVMDAVAKPESDASDPLGLAAWLAAEIGAERLCVAGPLATAPADATVFAAPADLASLARRTGE
jgi:dihydroneopterin aldolase